MKRYTGTNFSFNILLGARIIYTVSRVLVTNVGSGDVGCF